VHSFIGIRICVFININFLLIINNSVALVYERTVATEQSLPVGEVSAQRFVDRGCGMVSVMDPNCGILDFLFLVRKKYLY
jgi:hypothetical protein